MQSGAEVTARYAKVYVKAKKDKGQVLDEVMSVTGWSRDNARRRLVAAAKRTPGAGRQVAKKPRKQRSPKFSYDAVKVLQRVWAASGGPCGKYLAASMRTQLAGLERHGEEAELIAYRDQLNPRRDRPPDRRPAKRSCANWPREQARWLLSVSGLPDALTEP